mmetsp:Transcript_7430/g.14882  ORF Transcript_7430/g.14882 Transcript_7430/m.14882 type:complete len:223 (+) Transcript_7430:278-946(+)
MKLRAHRKTRQVARLAAQLLVGHAALVSHLLKRLEIGAAAIGRDLVVDEELLVASARILHPAHSLSVGERRLRHRRLGATAARVDRLLQPLPLRHRQRQLLPRLQVRPEQLWNGGHQRALQPFVLGRAFVIFAHWLRRESHRAPRRRLRHPWLRWTPCSERLPRWRANLVRRQLIDANGRQLRRVFRHVGQSLQLVRAQAGSAACLRVRRNLGWHRSSSCTR